ncbi:DUF1569 domain-containing protein [Pseudomarimonas arenosa]|uniref:DUF1569 domain-containing protein n=1 Tax=Pseudomarimonas arenosa TaxID=2774145 RepID=A0AAW3ZQP2_9GAMM|nr:DUF1569 domain-containing protein [Pseudomarimonas arenosa]MBD8526912.1 DUF1569 domain-containing protein [Pseudomarimonas arenosa]
MSAARAWLSRLQSATEVHSQTAWPVPQVIEHLAQSIEFSLTGYPEPKPEWFQSSLGRLANAAFQRAGAMHHDLEAPIPGAEALSMQHLHAACRRLHKALDDFLAFSGEFHPHFAYGPLGRESYLRAHLMHLADHAAKIELVA